MKSRFLVNTEKCSISTICLFSEMRTVALRNLIHTTNKYKSRLQISFCLLTPKKVLLRILFFMCACLVKNCLRRHAPFSKTIPPTAGGVQLFRRYLETRIALVQFACQRSIYVLIWALKQWHQSKTSLLFANYFWVHSEIAVIVDAYLTSAKPLQHHWKCNLVEVQ